MALNDGDTTPHGDYELRYEHVETGSKGGRHAIEAHHPEDGKVSRMEWMGRPPYAVHNIQTQKDHRRQGLATAMWNWAQDNARPRPTHSAQRTDNGEAWARSVGGKLPRRISRREESFPDMVGTEGFSRYFGGWHGISGTSIGSYFGGRGKPRRDGGAGAASQGGGGSAPQGGEPGQGDPVGAGQGGTRSVEFHPQAVKDLAALDKPVQRQIHGVIEGLAAGTVPLAQTHTLTKALSGWSTTKASRGHRIVHRNTDDGGLHIGYIGLHDYGKAERRLGSLSREPGPVTFPYLRNTEGAPNLGRTYGQDIEPHGRYLSYHAGDKPEGDRWETGEVSFQNPLHLDFGGNYGDPSNWKNQLSQQHGGKRGKTLSRAVVKSGHDGIITHDEYGPSEIVDLTGLKAKTAIRDIEPIPAYQELAKPWERRIYDVPESVTEPISRGLTLPLSDEDHTYVHDRSIPARVRSSHVINLVSAKDSDEPLGMHWTTNAGQAHHFSRVGVGGLLDHPNLLSVVLHAHPPEPEHIERDPRILWHHGVQGQAAEGEVPLKQGSPVRIHGVEWSDARDHTKSHSFHAGMGSRGIVRKAAKTLDDLDHHQRAVADAQNAVRLVYPAMHTMIRPGEDADAALRHMLKQHGHPKHEDAFVGVHDGSRGFSSTAKDRETGAVGVVLHPERADYGTLAHEAAHLLHDHQTGRGFRQPAPDESIHGIGFIQHYAALLEPFGKTRTPGGNRKSGGPSDLLLNTYYDSLNQRRKTSSHAAPTSRVFGPTFGLDHRLFEGETLKPEVRAAVMGRLGPVLEPLLGQSWEMYTRVYLAGSEASEWTSATLEGNGDFDTLIGIDYDHARDMHLPLGDLDDNDITDMVNTALRTAYNASPWRAPFGGTWDLTGYCNAGSWDITRIKPYAAYNITDDTWAVRPPHLPNWGIDKLPEGGQNLLAEAEGYAAVVDAISKMPEPFQTQQGKALWHHLHSDRGRAFSDDGEGWLDPGNLIEKALVEWGVWDKLVEWQYGKQHTAAADPPTIKRGVILDGHPVTGHIKDGDWNAGGWDPDVAHRLVKGTATHHDVLKHLNTNQVGHFWYHPDHADLEDAQGFASPSEPIKNWMDDPGEDGRIAGEVGVVMEAHHPKGWDPNEQNPSHPLMGNSYLPDNSHLRLHKLHYTADGGENWHTIPVEHHGITVHTDGSGDQKTAVKSSDHELAPDLPQEQHDALTAEPMNEYYRQSLNVAKNPVAGTHMWRGETRSGDPVKGAHESGVGMHWGINPSNILFPHVRGDDEQSVVYHAELEHPGEQNYTRDHPMWQGKHRSLDHEAEIRLKPGSKVKLHGVWVKDPKHPDPGYFIPRMPERMSSAWSYHPIGEHVTIAHKPKGLNIDYGDVGIGKEGNVIDITAYFKTAEDDDYRLMHRPPNEQSGRPLHHLDPDDEPDEDEHVRIYRSAPPHVDHFDTNTWATTNPEYAHLHGRHSTDPSQDWPVMSAEVPKSHVYTDFNDDNEVGYQGPRLEANELEQHHEETGEHTPFTDYQPPKEDEPAEYKPKKGEMWGSHVLKLSPEDYKTVTERSFMPEAAKTVLKHLGNGVTWHPKGSKHTPLTVQDQSDHWHAETHAEMLMGAQHPSGGHEPGTAPLLGVVVHTKNGKTIDRVGVNPHMDYSDKPSGFYNGFKNLPVSRAAQHPSLKAQSAKTWVDYFGVAA